MREKGVITMSNVELRRLKVIEEAIERRITQEEASSILDLSERQVRRLVKRVREQGAGGIVHCNRGKRSNRKIPDYLRTKVIGLYREKYHDFGPTLASEKLFELDGISISKETLRSWLMEEGLWERRRKRRVHRRWRERKPCCGQMVQMDGSHHDWLEGRWAKLVLMSYIDDATNKVFARFYDYEGTFPAMDSFWAYIEQYGIPQSVYLDKHTTYKSTGKLTIEEELAGLREPQSQFERALKELGVRVIHAHSPQAKGRIERLFGTLQDRLIKEMRLAGIATKDEANQFLIEYLPIYNKRFSILPAEAADLHWEVPKGIDLDRIFSVRTKRTLRSDYTIVHEKQLYQIEDRLSGRKPKSVLVEEHIDGRMYITHKGRNLNYRKIEIRPPKPKAKKSSTAKRRKAYRPPSTHPWRTVIDSSRGEKQERRVALGGA